MFFPEDFITVDRPRFERRIRSQQLDVLKNLAQQTDYLNEQEKISDIPLDRSAPR